MAQKKVTLIIPSFNGREILRKSLPMVLKYSPNAKIIVVDDGSDDGTGEFLSSAYPQVKVLSNPQNLGFPQSINRGVKAARTEFIGLLNNDVYPQKDYLISALEYFSDPLVAAVTFNEAHSSWPQTSWSGGKLEYRQGTDKSRPVYSTWASGGSCLIRRQVWKTLGGFNPIYSPGYWEDIDLGWRIWKSGGKIVWAPDAKVVHRHESTFKKLNQDWLDLVKQRNELLFIWQNITDLKLLLSHLWFLKRHSLRHPGYLKVVFAAFSRVSQARQNPRAVRSDREILQLVNQPL